MRAKLKRLEEGRTNFFYLLGALLTMLVAVPLAQDLKILSPAMVKGIFFSILMIVGARSLEGGGRYFTVGMILAAIGVVLNVAAIGKSSLPLQLGSTLSLIAFLLVSISFTMRKVIHGTKTDANRIVGAICVYLLLGVIWALCYSLLSLAEPASFKGIDPGTEAGWGSGWIYFSFVTLTTLGYGDITPVTASARGLVYLQAIVGQFYIAVLVAGIVSAYISEKQSS